MFYKPYKYAGAPPKALSPCNYNKRLCLGCNEVQDFIHYRTYKYAYLYKDSKGKAWKGNYCSECYRIKACIKRNDRCIVCDLTIMSRSKRYCSRECYNEVNKKPRIYNIRKCIDCLCWYPVIKETQKYCNIAGCIKKPELHTNNCVVCNVQYTSVFPNKRFCNKKCKKKFYTQSNDTHALKKINRVPKWSNIKEINKIYKNRPKDHHIDHIIPVRGVDVSGLHVPWNLQYLHKDDNVLKSNSNDGTYDNLGWKVNKTPKVVI